MRDGWEKRGVVLQRHLNVLYFDCYDASYSVMSRNAWLTFNPLRTDPVEGVHRRLIDLARERRGL